MKLKYYGRHPFHSFWRKVIFLNIKHLEKKRCLSLFDVKKKNTKAARDEDNFFCLDSSVFSPSLNMKVPKAQMLSLLFTLTPCEIPSSTGFTYLSHVVTPDLTSSCPPTPGFRTQAPHDLLLEWAVGISNFAFQTPLLDFTLLPSFLHSNKCRSLKPWIFLSRSCPAWNLSANVSSAFKMYVPSDHFLPLIITPSHQILLPM